MRTRLLNIFLVLVITLSAAYAQADIASDIEAGALSVQEVVEKALDDGLSAAEIVTQLIAAGVNPVLAAEFVAIAKPSAAAEIAKAAAIAVPEAAVEIAGTVAQAVPEAAAEIAKAVAIAVPEAAVEIAGTVAEAVPEAAVEIAATVAQAVPEAAAEIADTVAQVVVPEAADSMDTVEQTVVEEVSSPPVSVGGGDQECEERCLETREVEVCVDKESTCPVPIPCPEVSPSEPSDDECFVWDKCIVPVCKFIAECVKIILQNCEIKIIIEP